VAFSSHLFLFYFLPFSLGLYYLTPIRGRNLLLTLLSFLTKNYHGAWKEKLNVNAGKIATLLEKW